MNASAHRRTRGVWGILVLVLLVTGCRTYGAYDAREKTLEEIQQAAERFAEDFERARAERDALQRAAASNSALTPFIERFDAILERQETLVAEQQTLAAEADAGTNPLFAWVGPDSYRHLHRAYGAMVTDQRIIRDRYRMVLDDLALAQGTMAAPGRIEELGRYQVAPQFYQRLINTSERRTVAMVLSPAPAPQPAEAAPEVE